MKGHHEGLRRLRGASRLVGFKDSKRTSGGSKGGNKATIWGSYFRSSLLFRSNISRGGCASHLATFIKIRASYFVTIEYSVTGLRILILIFIILVLAVFEVLIVVTAKDVASEVKDCARDDLEG